MTDEKQIEEMAKDFKCCVSCEMFGGYVNDNNEIVDGHCIEHTIDHCKKCYISTTQAKVLHNANYRKIPEGSVVLTKEEFEFMCVDTKKVREEEVKLARKETAREIIDMLKQPPYIDFLESWVIDEIAERFGVETKDENNR